MEVVGVAFCWWACGVLCALAAKAAWETWQEARDKQDFDNWQHNHAQIMGAISLHELRYHAPNAPACKCDSRPKK